VKSAALFTDYSDSKNKQNLADAQQQILDYTQGYPVINDPNAFIPVLSAGIQQEPPYIFSGEVAASVKGSYYFIKFSCKSGYPQIIEYTYTSMTRKEYEDYQRAQGRLTLGESIRFSITDSILDTPLPLIQVLKPLLP